MEKVGTWRERIIRSFIQTPMRWLPAFEEHLHGSTDLPSLSAQVLEDDGARAASQIQSNTGQAQNGTQPSPLILGLAASTRE